MEKRNPIIKKAFEEAAKRELDNLPEEKFVIRAYSNEFVAKVEKLFSSNEKNMKETQIKRFVFRRVAIIAAVILCFTVITAGATGIIKTFSNEWRDSLKENILNAETGAGVEEFDKEIEKSTDPFAVASRNTDGASPIILDYSESMEFDNIIYEDEGYSFELKSVTKAQKKHKTITGGRISDGTATFEWTVSDAYYAIIHMTRTDREKLTQMNKDIVWEWNYLISGYSPILTTLCFRDNTIEYCDEQKRCFAVEITEMMPFAAKSFALVPVEFGTEIDTDTLYADENGNFELKNKEEYLGALLKFSVDEKYADEKYEKNYFKDKGISQPENWFESYKTDSVE